LPQFKYTWISDQLTTDDFWQHTKSTTKYHAGCEFGPDGLTATLQDLTKTSSYRCTGPTTAFGDFRVAVTVTLGTADSCAAIWFRFNQSQAYGYALQICADEVTFATHSVSLFAPVNVTALKPALTTNAPTRFAIVASGNMFTILRCANSPNGCDQPRQLVQIKNTAVQKPGEITVGIFQPQDSQPGSYNVTFADIQVDAATPPPSPSPSPSTSTVTPPAVEPSPSTSSSSASP
jgi:hypothetical protein